jgi:hypothetical protein
MRLRLETQRARDGKGSPRCASVSAVRLVVAALVALFACGRTLVQHEVTADGGRPDGGASDAGCVRAPYTDACSAVADSTWASVTEGECGLCAPGQVCTCTWHVTFSSPDSWHWQHSDFGESGTYGCTGLTLTIGGGQPGGLEASYAPACDLLTWDGVVYRRER